MHCNKSKAEIKHFFDYKNQIMRNLTSGGARACFLGGWLERAAQAQSCRMMQALIEATFGACASWIKKKKKKKKKKTKEVVQRPKSE